MKSRYVNGALTLLLFLVMTAMVVVLWRGVIPIDWLASLGYKGIFLLSLINGIAPVGGPSQVATFFVAIKLNPLGVGVTAGVGGAIGEVAGYALGYTFRAAQSDSVERKIERIANWRFLRITREHSFIPLFILASIPNPFFDPASALAGSLRIGLTRYFIPVLLGKTTRHVVIAYAGYYTISGKFALALNSFSIMTYMDSVWFVVGVLGIALMAWLVRSYAESDPDPVLLNFTFFAFAGQCILTAELLGKCKSMGLIIGLDLLALILVVVQTIVIKAQVSATIEHYKTLLEKNNIGSYTFDQIERWADVLVRITGVDFYPEFYINIFKGLGPRDKRRRQAVLILPLDQFRFLNNGAAAAQKVPADALKISAEQLKTAADALKVLPKDRQGLWRAYAIVCIISWSVFIICILVARRLQQ